MVRVAFVISLTALVMLAGCHGAVNLLDSKPPTKPTPTRPATLTNDSVEQYVNDTESARVHNRYRDNKPDRFLISCDAAVDERTARGFIVYAMCNGGVYYGKHEHSDVLHRSIYYVSDEDTARVTDLEINHRSGSHPDDDRMGVAGFRVYNLDSTDHNVTVEIRKSESSNESPVNSFEYSLAAHNGIIQGGVPFEKSTPTYRIEISMDGKPRTTYEWRPGNSRSVMGIMTVVYVTPEGDVFVGRLPSLV